MKAIEKNTRMKKQIDWQAYEQAKKRIADTTKSADEFEAALKAWCDKNGF
jgi:hypothetical protein